MRPPVQTCSSYNIAVFTFWVLGMTLIHARHVGCFTAAGIVLVMLSVYYMQNGLWLPQPILIRWNPERCPTLWWPKGEVNMDLCINSTKRFKQPNECASVIDYEGAARMKRAIEKTNMEIQNTEKENISYNNFSSMHQVIKPTNPVAFQPIDFTGGYVVSAFIDRRVENTPDIKVLYIIPFSSPTLYCQTFCGTSYIYVPGRPMFLPFYRPAHLNCIWQQYLLHCLFPPECEVRTVSVTSSPCVKPTNSMQVIQTNSAFKPPTTFAACLNIIFNMGEEDLPKLIRFVEAFLLIGGEKIYLYGMHKVHNKIKEAVTYYVKRGVINFYDWKIPPDVTNIFYYAQVLQNMDCLYRHMMEVEHLLYLDMDESILPIQHQNLSQLLIQLKSNKDYAYEAGFHINRVKISYPERSKQDSSEGKLMLPIQKDFIGVCIEAQTKPMVRPRNTVQVGVHYMDQPLRPFTFGRYLDTELAFVLHARGYNSRCSKDSIIQLPKRVQDIIRRKIDVINNKTISAMKLFQ